MTRSMDHHSDNISSSILITGLNKDKTRRENGSESMYHVYFELSGSPSQEWKELFDHQWTVASAFFNDTNRPAAMVDRGFLAVHCLLSEAADPYLPALQKAVAETNIAYAAVLLREDVLQSEKEDRWKIERRAVDEMEKQLKF
ncbi:MAG: hypothetical protein ACOYNS_13390 [Bacteroidota bacterium]